MRALLQWSLHLRHLSVLLLCTLMFLLTGCRDGAPFGDLRPLGTVRRAPDAAAPSPRRAHPKLESERRHRGAAPAPKDCQTAEV